MTPVQKSLRRLLETVIPDGVLARIVANYGLHLYPGATYGDALTVYRKRAAEGNTAAKAAGSLRPARRMTAATW